jgi:hypothetical protein
MIQKLININKQIMKPIRNTLMFVVSGQQRAPLALPLGKYIGHHKIRAKNLHICACSQNQISYATVEIPTRWSTMTL